jgi:TonB family protein
VTAPPRHPTAVAGRGPPLRVLFAPDARRYYPVAARRMQLQGSVDIRITIDARGFVTGAVVERSSGSDLLDTAALALARDYRFSSGTRVRTMRLPVVFLLDPVASRGRGP